MEKLNIRTNEATPEAEREIPVLQVSTGIVAQFTQAARDFSTAETAKDIARTPVMEAGLKFLFTHNTETPDTPALSVRLIDSEGNRALVSLQNKVKIPNEKAFEAFCAAADVEPEELGHMVAKAEFDDSIFISNGKFSTVIYNTYMKAVREATVQLISLGHLPKTAKVPLRTAQALIPKPDFSTKRWTLELTSAQQHKLHEVAPATVLVKASP